MLRLYVMRHAKSSWAVPGARDFDRELNERGLADLVKLGNAIKSRGYTPDKILCSSAVRTRATLEGIADSFSAAPEVTFTDKLYSSGLDDYMRIIQAEESSASLMVIGHNPMCGALAASLAGRGEPEMIDLIAYKYPTGTISVIDFDTDKWSLIEPRAGVLVDCLVPSTL